MIYSQCMVIAGALIPNNACLQLREAWLKIYSLVHSKQSQTYSDIQKDYPMKYPVTECTSKYSSILCLSFYLIVRVSHSIHKWPSAPKRDPPK